MNPAHKRWTEREEALLGTDTDAAIAAKLGRTPKAIEAHRRKLGIAAHRPHKRRWIKRELRLLGTMSDAALAERLGCSRRHVMLTRRAAKIKPFSPRNRPRKFRPARGT